MDDRYKQIRFVSFRVLAIVAFVIIAAKLWDLQIVSSAKYQSSADSNRFRLVSTDAPRGIIYDRYGRMLVRNVASFTVSIVPASLPDDAAERLRVLSRVAELLGMTVGEASDGTEEDTSQDIVLTDESSIEEILAERTISSYSAVRIASNVDRQAAFILEEEHTLLPGVVVAVEPLRHYLEGALTAHILGYVGQIPSQSLSEYLAEDEEYEPDDLVGLTGIEYTQESLLRGVKGQEHVEVDAYEREVEVLASQDAVPGNNVVLTLDLDLQRYVDQALREGMRTAGSAVGVAIAMDPRTGEVLAMVSLPSYDDNLFSGGISSSDYAALSSDPNHPMMNHAISGQYPPGSTFKLVSATAILEENIVDQNTYLHCGGTLYLPNKYYPEDLSKAQPFYCWYKAGHGDLNIVGAIMQSCDIYFYQAVGGYGDLEGLGYDLLADYARQYGYGEASGIELTGEASGLIPDDRWKRQYYGEHWVTGDTYNAAIGQGYILATPLQVLNMTATVANGGTLHRPQLVYQVTDSEGKVVQGFTPIVLRTLDTPAEDLDLIRQGMLDAVQYGTAWLAKVPGLSVAAKTGTAEYAVLDEEGNLVVDEKGYLPTHAWFTCFAPYEDPEIALVIFLEGGGEGSQTAAPVAADILSYYFGLNAAEPTPTVTTTE